MNKNVLILHPTWPRPDLCSGDYQLDQLIRLLRRAGHGVTVVGLDRLTDPDQRRRYGAALLQIGCDLQELHPHPVCHQKWGLRPAQEKLRHLVDRNRFDAALISFWNVTAQFVPLLRKMAPRTRLVVHSWDVWYLREMRGAALAGHLPRLQDVARQRHQEMTAYAETDAVLAVTEADGLVIAAGMKQEQRANPDRLRTVSLPPVVTVPHLHPLTAAPPAFADRNGFVFVGYFGHEPNQDAALFLGKEVWPLVAQRLPSASLKIIGADPPEAVRALASDRLQVTGFVPELEPVLDRARVSVAPLRYGAGLKGKVSQALASGLPVVTTPTGAEGMPLQPGRHALVESTPARLAEAMVSLHEDEALWGRLCRNGQRLVLARYSEIPAAAALFEALFGSPTENLADADTLPDEVRALNDLAEGLDWQFDRRCSPMAVSRFRCAADLDPSLGAAALAEAELQFDRGQIPRARECLQKAEEILGPVVGVLALAAGIHLRQGNSALAKQKLAAAVAIDPGHQRVMSLRGEWAQASGQTAEAARLFHEAIGAHPADFNSHRALSELLVRSGHREQAIPLLVQEMEFADQTGRNVQEKQIRQELQGLAEQLAGPHEPLPLPGADDRFSSGTPMDRASGPTRRRPEDRSGAGQTPPRVSVIIPVFDQLDWTRRCLTSLRRHTAAGLCEIIVVDNGSTDGTTPWLKQEARGADLRSIHNNKNRGFAVACNQGAAQASTGNLLFLNNDTELRAGWLEPLLATLEADPRVGAVGSKLLFPDGSIQHAGVAIADDRQLGDPLVARHLFYRQPADLPDANRPRCYQALTAACLLVRRTAFEESGGFDEGYWNGYEDIELCFTLNRNGWKLVYQPASIVVHHESQSGPARFTRVKGNIARLHQRWLGKVEPDLTILNDGSYHLRRGAFGLYEPPPAAAGPAVAGATSEETGPLASIIILTHNALAYSRQCIDSVLKHTRSPFEVILVDNGSDDGTVDYLREICREHPNCHLIANEENLGFPAGNNLGLARARGEYLVLLNNDVVVTEHWLDRLMKPAAAAGQVGLTGPMTNRIAGPQQLRRVDYDTTSLEGLPEFAVRLAREQAGQTIPYWRAVGFCLLIRREVIDRIGGLDERFGRGNFEDDDFCLRARLAGFETRLVRDCFVHHFGSRSFSAAKLNYRRCLLENWKIFKRKWGLPTHLRYGSGYDVSPHLPAGFDPAVHCCPLPQAAAPDAAVMAKVQEGESHFRDGRLAEARAIFEEILADDPGQVRARNDLACVLWQNGDHQQAVTELRTAGGLDPDDRDTCWNLGQFLCGLDRSTEAAQVYESYLARHPETTEFAEALARWQALSGPAHA